MPAIIRSIPGRREPVRPILIALLCLCAVFMFVDARIPPIIIWDESRLAVNALEMHLHGLSLVTTYGLAPDLWNTKPPLMIWLMALSVDLFGPSELALRFPAMLAGVATLAIVFVFVRRITLQVWPAAVAVLLLVTSVGFYGEHGARTGDYDALLCLFTTGYSRRMCDRASRDAPVDRGPSQSSGWSGDCCSRPEFPFSAPVRRTAMVCSHAASFTRRLATAGCSPLSTHEAFRA